MTRRHLASVAAIRALVYHDMEGLSGQDDGRPLAVTSQSGKTFRGRR